MKFVLKFLGGFLVVLGLWYAIMWFSQGAGLNTHLDLAAMINRFSDRYSRAPFNFTHIVQLITECKDLLLNLFEHNPTVIFANALLNNASGWSTTFSVVISLFNVPLTFTSAVIMSGYALAVTFEFVLILFTSVEPFLQLVFQPIFV